MFCWKCGNQLMDSDRFCAKCGAPVVKKSEPQEKPAAEPVYSQAPVAGRAETQPVNHRAAASVQKKSKKGLIIGFSVGGALLAVIIALALIFVFGQKGGGSGSSVPLGSPTVYDDRYTYFLSETETRTPCIMKVSNDLSGEPEILYESKKIEGDGWSQYTLGGIFLWKDKICFIEVTNATEQGDVKFEVHWISKDGKENGTLVSYEQLNEDNLLAQTEGVYFFEDYLILGSRFFFYRLDLNTGELCAQENFLGLEGPACFVAYKDGYYYYFVPDIENNLMGETLYRKAENSEVEAVGKVPFRDDDMEKYLFFIPKGNYLYYSDLANIYRLNFEDGSTEPLTFYERTYNRFTVSENGLYYFKDMTLRFLDTETLEESIVDKFELMPNLIYAGANDACWIQGDGSSHRYKCFLPGKQGGTYTYLGEKTNEVEMSEQTEYTDIQETVDVTSIYGELVELYIEDYGTISFTGDSYEFYVTGVYKIDLLDLNQDGIDELVVIYTPEGEGAFPVVDVWTVKDGEAVQLFSQKPKNESHESEITFSLYENDGYFYIPVYDTLDDDPLYVHLYGFDNNGNFGEVYKYENNDFYMNKLPDGMSFTACNTVGFYFNTNGGDDYESKKRTAEETLHADMESMLNELGIVVPENLSTQAGQSGFDLASMLGEWTLEMPQPNTEYVRHNLIQLNADGTMNLRVEDGSWLDYTYTMDATHFYFTYPETGITGGGTYTVSGDTLIVSPED